MDTVKNHRYIYFLIMSSLILYVGQLLSSNIILIFLIVLLAIRQVFSKIEFGIYLIFYLLPNIRAFDSLGVTFTVNVLIVLIFIKYIIKNHYRLNKKMVGFLLFFTLVETMHLFYSEDVFYRLLETTSWLSSFGILAAFLTDKKLMLNKNIAYWHLTLGVISSGVISFFTVGSFYTLSFLTTGVRLYGLAGDPNYYSIYILLAIFSTYSILSSNGKKIKYLISFLVLLLLGLLTGSKMFILLFGLFLLLILAYSIHNRQKEIIKFNSNLLYFMLIVLLGSYTFISDIFVNVINRFTGTNQTSTADYIYNPNFGGNSVLGILNRLSTGRVELLFTYLELFLSDFKALLLGYGRGYSEITGLLMAHNTYMDLLISWGFLGTTFFIYTMYSLFFSFKNKVIMETNFISFIPIIILIIMLFGLSAFDSDLLFFTIIYGLLFTVHKYKFEIDERRG